MSEVTERANEVAKRVSELMTDYSWSFDQAIQVLYHSNIGLQHEHQLADHTAQIAMQNVHEMMSEFFKEAKEHLLEGHEQH